MYFFAICGHFNDFHIQILETKLSRNEWKKRLAATKNFPKEEDAWRFHYNDNEFLDAMDWHISPALYLTEKLAREAAKTCSDETKQRWRRFQIRDASKRGRIRNKVN